MNKIEPEYIFETSWEVCNMVGGIYTVLSTRSETLYNHFQDKLIFIGPDIWKETESPYFDPSEELLSEWREHFTRTTGLPVRTGRWKVPVKMKFMAISGKNTELIRFMATVITTNRPCLGMPPVW